MKSKQSVKQPAITFGQLKRSFESSGFKVVLRRSPTLDKLSGVAGVRLRQIQAATLGLIMPEAGEIAINADIPLDERAITLLHELVHLVDNSLSETATERQAQAMFRRLNPDQRGWLEFLVS